METPIFTCKVLGSRCIDYTTCTLETCGIQVKAQRCTIVSSDVLIVLVKSVQICLGFIEGWVRGYLGIQHVHTNSYNYVIISSLFWDQSGV